MVGLGTAMIDKAFQLFLTSLAFTAALLIPTVAVSLIVYMVWMLLQ